MLGSNNLEMETSRSINRRRHFDEDTLASRGVRYTVSNATREDSPVDFDRLDAASLKMAKQALHTIGASRPSMWRGSKLRLLAAWRRGTKVGETKNAKGHEHILPGRGGYTGSKRLQIEPQAWSRPGIQCGERIPCLDTARWEIWAPLTQPEGGSM